MTIPRSNPIQWPGLSAGVVVAAVLATSGLCTIAFAAEPRKQEAQVPRADTETGEVFRIVFDETGEPAPFAQVYYQETKTGLYTPFDLPARPQDGASRFTADEQGRVRVPRPAMFAYVFARSDSLTGGRSFLAREGAEDIEQDRLPEIRIARPEVLRIQLSPSDHIPEGTSITVRCLSRNFVAGAPDVDGVVEVANLRWLRACFDVTELTRQKRLASDERRVDILVKIEERLLARVQIPLTELGAGSMNIEIPRLAELHIQLYRPDGTPYRDPSLVRIEGEDWGQTLRSVDGVARLSGVVGESLTVLAVPADRSFTPSSEKDVTVGAKVSEPQQVIVRYHVARTPTVPGEVNPVYRAQLRESNGDPRSDETLAAWSPQGFSREAGLAGRTLLARMVGLIVDEHLHSDAAGVIEWSAGADALEKVSWKQHYFIPDTTTPKYRVTLGFDGRLLPGVNNLGVVEMQSPEVIAGGRVLDPNGRPAVGASVELWPRQGTRISKVFGKIATPANDEPLDGPVSTDQDGAFLVNRFDKPSSETVTLIASLKEPAAAGSNSSRETRVTVPLGARDVVITLPPQYVLRGSMVLPAGVDAAQFRVRFSRGQWGELPEVLPDGAFSAVVPNHSIFVRIYLKSENKLLTTIRDVLPQETTPPGDHPALTRIDVSDQLRIAHIQIVDMAGAAVSNCPVVVLGKKQGTYEADENGSFVLALGAGAMRVMVGDPTRWGQRTVTVNEDLTIALPDAMR